MKNEMKKILAILLCVVIAASLCACGKSGGSSKKPVEDTYTDTIEEAEKLVGIKTDFPETVRRSDTIYPRAHGRTVEVNYFLSNPKNMEAKISKSDNHENIDNFDYNCPCTKEVEHNGINFTLRGRYDDGMYRAALWTVGEYSYIVLIDADYYTSSYMTEEEILAICDQVK